MILSFKQSSINLTQHWPSSEPWKKRLAKGTLKNTIPFFRYTCKFPLLWPSKFIFILVSLSFDLFLLRYCGLILQHIYCITESAILTFLRAYGTYSTAQNALSDFFRVFTTVYENNPNGSDSEFVSITVAASLSGSADSDQWAFTYKDDLAEQMSGKTISWQPWLA